MESIEGPFRVGDVVAGKYRIEGVLGQGGMAVVYAAHHEMLAQPIALKVIRPAAGESLDVVKRFINEARAVARLRSEHVNRVMDVGVLEDGSPYIVMDRLVGMDLARTVETRGMLPAPLVVDYVLQALEAIAEAHGAGIVHRDLKPSNLFLAEETRGINVKVLDFGIFKAVDGFSGPAITSTSTGAILGTPAYMSPEQLRASKTVDARTDIWSIGVILYELLAGTPPFDGDTVGAVFVSVIEHVPPPLDVCRADLPRGLARVVEGCLQKDRDRRFATVVELAVALAPFASPESARSVDRIRETMDRAASNRTSATVTGPAVAVAPSAPRPAAAVQTARTWTRPSTDAAPRLGVWVPVGALVAMVLLAGGVFLVRSARAPQPPPMTAVASAPPTPEPAQATTTPPAPPESATAPLPPPTATAEPSPSVPPPARVAPTARPRAPSRPGTPSPSHSSPGLATDRQW